MINLDIINPGWLHEPKIELEKSDVGPPGPPPRIGLEWKFETHRWIRPQGIKEERFHSIVKITEEESRRLVEELESEAKKSLPKSSWSLDKLGSSKASWCLEVFSEALETISREKPLRLKYAKGYVEAQTFVYANDQGIPEVACVWALYPEDSGSKVLTVEFLATNPKNFKESTSKNKVRGMGTAAMYKIFEEAVQHKVSRIIIVPVYGSDDFYGKLGFKASVGGDFYELPIKMVRARLTEAGMLQKDNEFEELLDAEDKHGTFIGQFEDLNKARGVPEHAGPPPGPPPNPGLSWNYSSHRWIRPGKDQKTKSGLKINPEWTDVWINDDPTADVQARGIDKNGMKRTLTTAAHKTQASVAIFARVKELTPFVPELKNKFGIDSDNSEEASVMYVIARTGLRIGSDADTKAKVKAYGISTLKPEHVKVSEDKVSFDFVAKRGVHFTRTVTDQKMADIFRSRLLTGGDIFDTNDKRVRKYFKSIKGMKDFDIKDFRTYNGTKSALREIARMPKPTDKMMYTKQRMEVARIVAAELGNTPATALKYYIAPEVFLNWQFGLDNDIKKSSGESEQSMQDFVESVIYIEDIDWRNIPNPDPDDDDDYAEDILKAKRNRRDDDKPPDDNPLDVRIGGGDHSFLQGAEFDLGQRYEPPKPKSRFYSESSIIDEVYNGWAKERLDRREKLIVETKFNGFRTIVSKDGSLVDIWLEDNEHSSVKTIPEVASRLREIGLDFILDGVTMIYKGSQPIARVNMMKLMSKEIRLDSDESIVFVIFDIPYFKKDLSKEPLIERKRVLRRFFNEYLSNSQSFVLVEYALVTDKASFVLAVKKAARFPESEGAIIKESTSEYKQGSIDEWAEFKSKMSLKVKVLEKKESDGAFIYTCGVLIDG